MPIVDSPQAAEAYLLREGRTAASWLVWKHRERIHRQGYFLVHIENGQKPPRWFLFAIAGLRHSSRWYVHQPVSESRTEWMVGWRHWRHYGEAGLKRERNKRKRERRSRE